LHAPHVHAPLFPLLLLLLKLSVAFASTLPTAFAVLGRRWVMLTNLQSKL